MFFKKTPISQILMKFFTKEILEFQTSLTNKFKFDSNIQDLILKKTT